MSEEELRRYDVLNDQDWQEILSELTKAVRKAVPVRLRGEVDDLIQKAGVKLWRLVEKDETKRRVNRSYLWRVATTTVIDEARRLYRKMERSLEESADPAVLEVATADPERLSSLHQTVRVLRSCLLKLIPDRRIAVGLYLLGDSVVTIAELKGWNLKRTKNLVYRGLSDLKACLAARGIEDGRG